MTNLTRVQLANINEGCSNDFQLDVKNFIANDVTQLVKYVDINGNERLEYCLCYHRKYNIVKKTGEKKATNRYLVLLKISKWQKGDIDAWVDNGVIKVVKVFDKAVDHQYLKFLQKLTEELTDDRLLYYLNEVENAEIIKGDDVEDKDN